MIKLWSAGKHGVVAKMHITLCLLVINIWVLFLMLLMEAGSESNIQSLQPIAFCCAFLFCAVSIQIPMHLISSIVFITHLLRRNTRFELNLFKVEEFSSGQLNIDSGQIVFSDEKGIVVSNNKQAYEDWTHFF